MTKIVARREAGRSLLKAVSGNTNSKVVTPAVNLGDSTEEYVVYVAVPGMERRDFSVTIINKRLIVSAVKKEATHCFAPSDELSFPAWKEVFILPDDADTVLTAAIYKNGELEIHIPKGKDNPGSLPVEVFVY